MEMAVAPLDPHVHVPMDQWTLMTLVAMILIQTPAMTLIAIDIINVLIIIVVPVLVAMNPQLQVLIIDTNTMIVGMIRTAP